MSFVGMQIGAVFTVCAVAAGLAGWIEGGKFRCIDATNSVRLQVEEAKLKSVGGKVSIKPSSNLVEIVGPMVKYTNGRVVIPVEYTVHSRGNAYKMIVADRVYLEK